MPRYTDLNNRFNNVKWDGVDSDVVNFRNELYEKFPQLKVTSSIRTGNSTGKAGSRSRHNKGEALDLAFDKNIQTFLYSSEGDVLLRKHNLGFLDESLPEVLKKTGGTGPHFHIGKDSTLSGNSNKYNTAFKVNSSTTQTATNDPHDHEETLPENNLETPNNSEFFQKLYMEKMQQEEQASQEYELEKQNIERQNFENEQLQKKIEHQNSMLEMIQNHNLESVSRTRSFADGGEFEGLNDNLKFKIDAIKNSMPKPKFLNPEESESFMNLNRIRSEMQDIAKLGLESMSNTSQPQSSPNPVENKVEVPVEVKENKSVVEKLNNKLSELGLESHQIAGIIGSLSGESGTNLSSTARNPKSGAFGIAQWLGSRLQGLKDFGKERGRDFKNEDIQIEYLLHELQNTQEKKSLSALRKAKNIQEATMIWTRKFERPSESEIQNSISKRVKNAKMFHNQFS